MTRTALTIRLLTAVVLAGLGTPTAASADCRHHLRLLNNGATPGGDRMVGIYEVWGRKGKDPDNQLTTEKGDWKKIGANVTLVRDEWAQSTSYKSRDHRFLTPLNVSSSCRDRYYHFKIMWVCVDLDGLSNKTEEFVLDKRFGPPPAAGIDGSRAPAQTMAHIEPNCSGGFKRTYEVAAGEW